MPPRIRSAEEHEKFLAHRRATRRPLTEAERQAAAERTRVWTLQKLKKRTPAEVEYDLQRRLNAQIRRATEKAERHAAKAAERARIRALKPAPMTRAQQLERKRVIYRASYDSVEYRRRRILHKLRGRAKGNKLGFDLCLEDIQIPEICPVLGIPLSLTETKSGLSAPNSPSVDRRNNDRGYVKDNIQIISNRANCLKSNATLEEMRGLLRYMEESHGLV